MTGLRFVMAMDMPHCKYITHIQLMVGFTLAGTQKTNYLILSKESYNNIHKVYHKTYILVRV